MSQETYNVWSLVLQLVVWAATIGTLFLMRSQLNEMQKANTGQNLLALIDYVQSPAIREARTVVRRDLRTKPFTKWTPEEKRYADAVCANYDVLAVLLLRQRLAPVEPFLEHWGPSITDCYAILSEYILDLQGHQRNGPSYWSSFGELNSRCIKN